MNEQEVWDILDRNASVSGRVRFDRMTMVNIAKLDCFMIKRRQANNFTLEQLKRWCQDWYTQYDPETTT